MRSAGACSRRLRPRRSATIRARSIGDELPEPAGEGVFGEREGLEEDVLLGVAVERLDGVDPEPARGRYEEETAVPPGGVVPALEQDAPRRAVDVQLAQVDGLARPARRDRDARPLPGAPHGARRAGAFDLLSRDPRDPFPAAGQAPSALEPSPG